MDWNRMREQWQHDAPAASAVSIEKLRSLDLTLQKQVRRRDLIETVAAVAMAVFFTFVALGLTANAEWVALGFALLLVTWAIAVPLRLRRARRQAPTEDLQLPLVENLGRQRDAALAQAHMLERVWLWYLTPPAIGIFGLTLTLQGPSTFALLYLAGVLLLYLGIAWLNRYAAKTRFRTHARQLQDQIDALNQENLA